MINYHRFNNLGEYSVTVSLMCRHIQMEQMTFSRSGSLVCLICSKMHLVHCEFFMVSGLPVSNISAIGETKINIIVVNFLL